MTAHRKISGMLYDFLRGELGEGDARLVREHLGRCGRCSREAEELRSLLEVFPPPAHRPSDALPGSYWEDFASGVERRIVRSVAPVRAGWTDTVRDALRSVVDAFVFRRPAAMAGLAATGLAAVLAVALLTGREWGGRDAGPTETATAVRPEETAPNGAAYTADAAGSDTLSDFDIRVGNYFRKSKTLLVGMSNALPVDGDLFDLDAEKSASRSLLNEARYLRTGPVDPRSWRLMEDLDEIMIELANMDARTGQSSVGIVREGIRSRNLLFKLRMLETQSGRTPVRQAVYNH